MITLRKIFYALVLFFHIYFCFYQVGYTQNLNPSFPRIGQITFYPTGAGPVIWRNHDLVIIRYYYIHDAKEIKKQNPDVILLGTLGGIDGKNLLDNKEDIEGYPDVWYTKNADGKRIKAISGYLMNLTKYCPKADFRYGQQTFSEYAAQYLAENGDWTVFDGIFFDSWRHIITYESQYNQIDFNNNGVRDIDEDLDPNGLYMRGNETLIQNIRDRIPVDLVLAHEAGGSYLNGNGFEFWTQETVGSREWNMKIAQDLLREAVSPQLNYTNSLAEGFGSVFRADFTSSQIVGAFFGHDEGTFAHRWTFLHDEYQANLGYPTDSPEKLQSGLWIRYFDHGVIISNISGQVKTVSASQLSGGPYWRFLGQQDPSFNNGSQFESVTLESFDGIMLLKEPTVLVTPIVIDNVENNMTSLGQDPVQYIGTWEQSIRARDAYSLRYSWGEFSEYDALSKQGMGENRAIYTPKINVSGNYEIFEWHGRHENVNIASNTPFEIKINHRTQKTGIIDQTKNTGQWNSLGVYSIQKHETVEVILTNKANGDVISDAIQFVLTGKTTNNNSDIEPPNAPQNVKVRKKRDY